MGMTDWIDKLVQIPGRLTSIAIEKIVCGASEVWDDTLGRRQSELNSRFKAVTDQQQIAIDGGTASIAAGPEDIVAGSGAIATANAIAGCLTEYQKGSKTVIPITEDTRVSETVPEGEERTVIYLNNTEAELTVTVSTDTYRTPDGNYIVLAVPAGGYGEVSLLNIGGTIFARGC